LNRYVAGGSRLLLSGLLVEQRDEVLTVFGTAGVCVRRQRYREDWIALELAMTESCKGDPSCVHQINVSDGGVPKLPLHEALITKTGVSGDRQRSLKIHGGPERAVCLYSWELIKALQAEGHMIYPGSSGENLTLSGLTWSDLEPGDRLAIGEAVILEIAGYTAPCEHNARWFLNGDYSRISQKRHPGWSRLYARVLSEGRVCVGDAVKLVRSSQFEIR
jgi:MOSC domain-containing protein YiiM